MSSQGFDPLQIEYGHCCLVDMNPPRRSKPGKVRPVVVIQSSDTLAAGSPGVVVVPLTTKLQESNILRIRVEPSETLKIKRSSDLLLDQVHTIDRTLFLEDLGNIRPEDLAKIREGVRFLLDF